MKNFKQYLVEANTTSATLTEMAICYQYNVKIKGMSGEEAMSAATISPSDFSKFSYLLDVGENMVNGFILSNSGVEKQDWAVHYGSGNDKVTSAWSKYGAGAKAASRTPKTDIYIGKYK